MELCEENSGACEKTKNKKARQASLQPLVLLSMDLFLECAFVLLPGVLRRTEFASDRLHIAAYLYHSKMFPIMGCPYAWIQHTLS